MRIGTRLAQTVNLDFRTVSKACQDMAGINLGTGICDLPAPPVVTRAVRAALEANLASYTHPLGLEALRAAIAAKIQRCYGLDHDPQREVIVTVGATGGLAVSLLALCEPGDEVLLFEPYYGVHLNTVVGYGLTPVLVPLRPPDWRLDARDLERAWSPRLRAVLLCTPCNPNGKVWTRGELALVADFCRSHHLTAFTDEIYEHIVFDGAEHVPLATLPGMRERTVTVSGLSKVFSITGWRLGYLTAPARAVERMVVAQEMLSLCAPTPLQHGALAGMTLPHTYFAELSAMYEKKRDLLAGALTEAGLAPHVPQGAYYILCDARRLGHRNAQAAAMALLERTGVGSIAGSNFFRDPVGETLLRFCFAKADADLAEAAARLRRLT
jgi:aminotransferase